MNIRHLLYNMLFPFRCIGCGEYNHILCADCLRSIANPEYIAGTGQIDLFTYGTYTTPVLQKSIKQIKFHGLRAVGAPLGQALAASLSRSPAFSQLNASQAVVVPIPLHTRRLRERGYNQAAVIAHGVSTALNVPHISDALLRTNSAKRHSDLEHAERWQHIAEAFSVNPKYGEQLKGAHVLLIDDVITTGATISEAAQVLLDYGASQVIACGVARGG